MAPMLSKGTGTVWPASSRVVLRFPTDGRKMAQLGRTAHTADREQPLAAVTGSAGIVAGSCYRGGSMRISLFGLIYLAIGLVVALTHGYTSLASLSEVLSLLVAIVLWPLVLLGIDLHLPALTT
jgi:hypothetical protein